MGGRTLDLPMQISGRHAKKQNSSRGRRGANAGWLPTKCRQYGRTRRTGGRRWSSIVQQPTIRTGAGKTD